MQLLEVASSLPAYRTSAMAIRKCTSSGTRRRTTRTRLCYCAAESPPSTVSAACRHPMKKPRTFVEIVVVLSLLILSMRVTNATRTAKDVRLLFDVRIAVARFPLASILQSASRQNGKMFRFAPIFLMVMLPLFLIVIPLFLIYPNKFFF